MKIGTTVRNMGSAASRDTLARSARLAEDAGLAHLWLVDHVAVPPDDAEGSDGIWFDPLATLPWLAAQTTRIELGLAVLVLPYRAALPTAKWVATLQALCDGRLHLGVGAGWMVPEFRALGVDPALRGRLTDDTLDLIRACFDAPQDVVTCNGQPMLFRPRPARPPIYVGGMSEAALARAVRAGDGWLPMGIDPARLAGRVARLRELAAEAGRPCPEIVLIGGLPADPGQAAEQLAGCAELGATHFIQASRYADFAAFERIVERLVALRSRL